MLFRTASARVAVLFFTWQVSSSLLCPAAAHNGRFQISNHWSASCSSTIAPHFKPELCTWVPFTSPSMQNWIRSHMQTRAGEGSGLTCMCIWIKHTCCIFIAQTGVHDTRWHMIHSILIMDKKNKCSQQSKFHYSRVVYLVHLHKIPVGINRRVEADNFVNSDRSYITGE